MNTVLREKVLTVAILIILILFSVIINNHWRGDWSPNSPDEHGYIGAAMRLVVFQNKDLLPPPDSPQLFSYAMGVAHVVTGLEVSVLFHIAHTILLALIILSFYRLGRFHSINAGLLLAALITLYYAPSFYVGLWTMTPSLFMFLALPNIFLALFRSQYLLAFLWFILLVFLYWWGTVPFLVAIVLFFLLRDGKKRWLLLPLLLLAAYLLFHFLFKDFVLPNFPADPFPDWYTGRFLTIIVLYFFASVGFAFVLRSREIRTKPLGMLALVLVGTNLLSWVSISTYAHVRTVPFLWVGLFILVVIFFVEGVRYIPRLAIAAALTLFLAPLAGTVARSNAQDALEAGGGNITTFRAEQEALQWLKSQGGAPLVISDFRSMNIATFHLPLANTVFPFYYKVTSPEWIAVYNLLAQEKLHADDFSYLRLFAQEIDADAVYILISPRTREEVNYFEYHKRIRGKGVVAKDYQTIPQFNGEQKFRFDSRVVLVYDAQGVQVYRIINE